MSEAWFAGDHGPEGAWKTLKGSMLSPHTAGPIEGGKPNNTTRGSGSTITSKWDSNTNVSTGMTRGGGTMAK